MSQARLMQRALVTRPTEVVDGAVGRRDQAVDLLPRLPADVADPDLVGTRSEREAERVAQPVGDDATRVRIGARRERVAGQRRRRSAGSIRMIDPSRPTGSRIVRRSWARNEPPSAVGGVSAAPVGVRRVTARVAELAVVGRVAARAVARADVEHSVRTEAHVLHRVSRRARLAPVRDEHLLGAPDVAGGGESRHAPASRAAPVGRGAAGVERLARLTVGRRGATNRHVVDVADVHVRRSRGSSGAASGRSCRRRRSCRPPSAGRRTPTASGRRASRRRRIMPDFSATKTWPSGENTMCRRQFESGEHHRVGESGRNARGVRVWKRFGPGQADGHQRTLASAVTIQRLPAIRCLRPIR